LAELVDKLPLLQIRKVHAVKLFVVKFIKKILENFLHIRIPRHRHKSRAIKSLMELIIHCFGKSGLTQSSKPNNGEYLGQLVGHMV
jgi:hypothetical protein